MRSLVVYALFLTLTVVSEISGEESSEPTHSDVITLTDKNFDELTKAGNWLVEFYAPWCKFCKKLAPEWEIVATKVKGNVHVAKVDCDVEKSAAKVFGIRSYPSIRFFRDGQYDKAREYKGARTADAFIEYCTKLTGPPVLNVTNETFKDVAELNPVIFAYFTDEDEDVPEAYVSSARQYQDTLKFVQSSDPALFREYVGKTAEPPALVLIKDGDVMQYAGPIETEAISRWIQYNRYQSLPELDDYNFQDITFMGKPTVLGFIDPFDKTNAQPLLDTLKRLSKIWKREFMFAHLNAIKWKAFASQFNISTEDLPQVMVLNAPKNRYYYTHGMRDAAEIEPFLKGIVSGAIKGSRREASNFQEFLRYVYDDSKEYILERPHIIYGTLSVIVAIIAFIFLKAFSSGRSRYYEKAD